MSEVKVIIYEGKSGTRVDLKSLDSETMWATQKQMCLQLVSTFQIFLMMES